MKQFSTHDLLWALMSSYRRSCVLMSTHKHLWVWCYGAMSAHECWLTLIASWHHAHVCFWALMSAHCSMVPSSWLLMSAANEQSWALMSPHKPSWALISSQEQLWVFLITIEHSWAAINAHEFGAMQQWPLVRAKEQSWAWRHEALSPHQPSWAVMAPFHHTQECSWVIMITHEGLWELMSADNRSWALICFIKQ